MTAHHTHTHGDGHGHWPAGETPPAGGPVVLDIGDDVGALIVYVIGDDVVGHELHVRRVGSSAGTTHTGIWRRNIADRDDVIAIFPELIAGNYEVLNLQGGVSGTTFVPGGAIAEMIVELKHS
jgi:hypothetical protein